MAAKPRGLADSTWICMGLYEADVDSMGSTFRGLRSRHVGSPGVNTSASKKVDRPRKTTDYETDPMKLHEMVPEIETKADLVAFIQALAQDLKANPDDWENRTLPAYLEALADWVDGSEYYYINHKRPVPVAPSWRDVGEMLMAAKMYE
jgi:hypothetical protein